MKTYSVILFILLSLKILSIKSQTIRTIDFDDNVSLVRIDTSNKNNIWHIGPGKADCFDNAFSGTNAIYTDTSKYYSKNSNSYFEIKLTSEYTDSYMSTLSFWHKYDTYSSTDSGYLECSYDKGLTWFVLKNDFSYSNEYYAETFWQHENEKHTWFTGLELSVKGNSNNWFPEYLDEWLKSTYIWLWDGWPCSIDNTLKSSNKTINQVGVHPDELYIRFVFVSDSVQRQKCGWIIDDIKINGDIMGIEDNKQLTEMINLYPNPYSDQLNIIISEQLILDKILIINNLGEVMSTYTITDKHMSLDINKYPTGLYFVQFFNNERLILTKKIINK